jgi:hypothetical protein
MGKSSVIFDWRYNTFKSCALEVTEKGNTRWRILYAGSLLSSEHKNPLGNFYPFHSSSKTIVKWEPLELYLYNTVRHKYLSILTTPTLETKNPVYSGHSLLCVMLQPIVFVFNSFATYRRNLTTMFTYYFKAAATIQLLSCLLFLFRNSFYSCPF